MKRLTIVCPAYNEEEGIADFHTALTVELQKLSSKYSSDILFVVDGGSDHTFEILKGIADKDEKVRIIKFSRNFGHQMALLAGLDVAEGDAVIMMDSDLQHPPEVIPQLLFEYEKGSDIVITIRTGTEGASFARRAAGAIFYKFFQFISDLPINENAADFRLMSRRTVDVLKNDIRERTLFLRGIISWMGFRQASVSFTAKRRFAGKSHYPIGKLISFAVLGAVSFSKKPLRFATLVGFFFAAFGFFFALITIIQYFVGDVLPPGWATVTVLLSLFSGTQLIFLGILGEYIGVIFDEVKVRPHYIVEERVNLGVPEHTPSNHFLKR